MRSSEEDSGSQWRGAEWREKKEGRENMVKWIVVGGVGAFESAR